MGLRTLLVPTDLSAAAEHAFAPAAELAVHSGATVIVVQVIADPEAPASGRVVRVDGPGIGDEAFEHVPVVELAVEASDVAAALVEQAGLAGADLIVMGTHGRSGFSRLGRVAEAVARTAPCPVLLVHEGPDLGRWHVGRVLVAVDPGDLYADGLALSRQPCPVRWAAALAASFGAHVDLLTVVDGAPDREYPSLRRCAASLLALTLHLSQDAQPPMHVDYAVRQGDPVESIVAEAERSAADLLVVGTHGRRGLRRLEHGSVAEAVSRDAPCPVLVVPPTASAVGAGAHAAIGSAGTFLNAPLL